MISADIKAKITDPAALAEVEKTEQLLYDVTEESKKRKLSIRDLNSLLEKVKKIGIDPEGDVDEQFEKLFEESSKKKNLKPASEMETLSKQLAKLTNELTTWKETAAKNEKEAKLEKCKSAFSGKLAEPFGKSAGLILDNAILRGLITVDEKGNPGVMQDDEFFPIESDKGKLNGIDALKKIFADHVVAKQKNGGSDVRTQISNQSSGKEPISRSDFEQLGPLAKINYMKEVGQFSDPTEAYKPQ